MKKLFSQWPVPKYAHLPLILCLVTMSVFYGGPRVLGVEPKFDFALPIDGRIPLIPAFSYIYILAYVYWAVSYISVSRFSKTFTKRIFLCDLLGKMAAFLCFLLLPITIARPPMEEIVGAGAWLTKIIYLMDEPINLFPSLHCFVSYISVRPLFAKDAPRVSPIVKITSIVFALLVCLSTLFTRQHLVADVISGIALGEIAWLLACAVTRRLSEKAVP